MKISYYPGCTLKTKAQNMDDTVTGSLQALGVEFSELERWNCCGAAFSLVDDNLLSLVAPVRNLIRVMEAGSDTVITACSLCYNSLARANLVMRDDEEKRKTINMFMEEEPDYHGEVKVYHLLNFLGSEIGWDVIRSKITNPLKGIRVAPYYGCLLMRPREIAIDVREYPRIFEEFIGTLGAEVVDFPSAHECCGSYQVVSNPEIAVDSCNRIVEAANTWGADAIISSCPLCEFNLGRNQELAQARNAASKTIPTYYFTQMLALALQLKPELCHFELNTDNSVAFLKERHLLSVA